MIPENHLAAVSRGLQSAFGVDAWDGIRDLTGGPASNRAFRIEVRGSAYLLRINTRAGDMARQFACMRAAAEAGLAPRVWYASVDDRVCITDFVEAVPLPRSEALRLVPAALRRLHALPAFPGSPYNTTCTFLLGEGAALQGFLRSFRESHILPASETEELLAQAATLAEEYRAFAPDLVPCHNDLFKPDNMLFDGTRLWLVDWEAAFQNDRYAELAVVANLLCESEAEERLLLRQYFGESPSAFQLDRLRMMRKVAHIFYALAFLSAGSRGKPVDFSEPLPECGEYQRRFWAREISLVDDQSKVTYGRVHLQQLRHTAR